MKTIYFIRHANVKKFKSGESDFEREISNKGKKNLKTITSYLQLVGIKPQLILSSCALYAQQTAVWLRKQLNPGSPTSYLEQLYHTQPEQILEIITAADDDKEEIFIVGHSPYLVELVNKLSSTHVAKIPPVGVVAIHFTCDSWADLQQTKGDICLFIFPKQFHYYMPKQIQATLSL